MWTMRRRLGPLHVARHCARATALVTFVMLASSAPAAHAEQRWQCGDGITVPLHGTRAEREAACKNARLRRDRRTVEREHSADLERRIEQLEKQYGVDIDVQAH